MNQACNLLDDNALRKHAAASEAKIHTARHIGVPGRQNYEPDISDNTDTCRQETDTGGNVGIRQQASKQRKAAYSPSLSTIQAQSNTP